MRVFWNNFVGHVCGSTHIAPYSSCRSIRRSATGYHNKTHPRRHPEVRKSHLPMCLALHLSLLTLKQLIGIRKIWKVKHSQYHVYCRFTKHCQFCWHFTLEDTLGFELVGRMVALKFQVSNQPFAQWYVLQG